LGSALSFAWDPADGALARALKDLQAADHLDANAHFMGQIKY